MASLRPRLQRLRAAAVVGAACAALALLPFSTCLSRIVLRRPCPGCGMTRAVLALLRGDVAASLRYNPAALPGAALAAAAVALAAALPEGHPLWGRFTRAALTALALALTAVWALRLAGVLADV
ncbi:MAG: DUF2752 domain-containing protein [Polyangiales bacterium]